jgi:O-antigen ligase
LTWFIIALATVLCFYGAWQFTSARNTVWGLDRADIDYTHRASGAYVNPNHFAGLLGMLLPVAISMAIASRMKALGRVLLIYTILVMLAGLALTHSRGGWLASGFGMTCVLIALARNADYRRPALITLAILGLAAVAVTFRSEIMKGRLAMSHDLDPQARNSRPNIWRPTIAMWKDHQVWGVGPAHFNERFRQYRTHWAHGEPDRAHNDYLNTLADWGTAGTAVVAVPWLLLAYGVGRTLRQVRRDPGSIEVKRSGRYAFVLGASSGLAALLTHSLTDFNFHIPGNALVAVTWIALLAGYSRYATDNWWVSSKLPWRFLVSLLALALAAALGWDFLIRGRAQLHIVRAAHQAPASDAQLTEFEAAWKADPRNPWTAYEIGELQRLRSFTGTVGYEKRAREAIEWFDRAALLNPYHPAFPIRAGMCLDWLGQLDDGGKRFQHALKLDPQGYVTSCFLGWHELQKGDEAAARAWFIKSTEQAWPIYEPAMNYLRLLENRARARVNLPPLPDPAPPAATPSPAPRKP